MNDYSNAGQNESRRPQDYAAMGQGQTGNGGGHGVCRDTINSLEKRLEAGSKLLQQWVSHVAETEAFLAGGQPVCLRCGALWKPFPYVTVGVAAASEPEDVPRPSPYHAPELWTQAQRDKYGQSATAQTHWKDAGRCVGLIPPGSFVKVVEAWRNGEHELLSVQPVPNADSVSHDQAREILSRFNASHFNNKTEHARYSIPARPEDDDISLARYIDQNREREAELGRLRARVVQLEQYAKAQAEANQVLAECAKPVESDQEKEQRQAQAVQMAPNTPLQAVRSKMAATKRAASGHTGAAHTEILASGWVELWEMLR
jgi:hypothetical protein